MSINAVEWLLHSVQMLMYSLLTDYSEEQSTDLQWDLAEWAGKLEHEPLKAASDMIDHS